MAVLKTSVKTSNLILATTGSQCSEIRRGVTGSLWLIEEQTCCRVQDHLQMLSRAGSKALLQSIAIVQFLNYTLRGCGLANLSWSPDLLSFPILSISPSTSFPVKDRCITPLIFFIVCTHQAPQILTCIRKSNMLVANKPKHNQSSISHQHLI